MNMPCRNTAALDAKMDEDDNLYDDLARQKDRDAFADHMIEEHALVLFEEVQNDMRDAIGGAFGAFLECAADGDECGVGRLFIGAMKSKAKEFYDSGQSMKYGWPA